MNIPFRYSFKIILICLLISHIRVNAQTLSLNEDFNLVAGTNLAGQNDWTAGASSTIRAIISNTGLTYLNYPNQLGLAAYFSPTTDRVQKTFTGTLSGTYYYSFLINVSSAGSGEFFVGFYSNSAFRGRTYLKSDGLGFQFGLTKTTTGPVVYTSGVPFSFGTTNLIVVKYEFLAGSTTDDKVSLFVNPDLTANDPGTPVIGPLTDAGNDVSANVFAIQGRANSGNFTLDGIRVAPDWASIKGETVKSQFIELPKFISSNMVLQRETPLKFNGWGSVGDTVKVTFSRQGNTFSDSTVIKSDGRWGVELPAQHVSTQPCTLKFELKNNPNTIEIFDNILVGDVWFAAGQSNMEKKVSHLLEATQVIAEADNYPLIRSFRASYNAVNQPQEKVNSSSAPWFVCNSTEVGEKVSAVAYIFAREVYKSQNIPIGIMQSYRGGTELETWMSGTKITSDPELCKVAGRIAGMDPTNANNYPSINYNGQIHPLTGFPIKGFLFYQGESNTKRALEYRLMMKKLIEDWRNLWGLGNLPFYYVQLFNMGIATNQLYEEGNWQDIREQQLLLLTADNVPNIGMAVSIDTNEDPNNADDLIRIHPKNKVPVGQRLSLIALKNTYDRNIVAESPVVSNYRFANDSAIIVFKNVGTGLKIKMNDAELKGFVLAGSNKVFKSATATIKNDSTVIIKSNFVSKPISVRYGWAKNPNCNLYNSGDLPASPFRTDCLKSDYSYSLPVSTCAPSANASLMNIKVNGIELSDFDSTEYYYNFNPSEIQQVSAYSNSPFATVSIEQATEQNGRKAIITVFAENKSTKTYIIDFKKQTAIRNVLNDKFKLIQDLKTSVVHVNSEINGRLTIFNSIGQNIISKTIVANTNTQLSIKKTGVYLAILNTPNNNHFLKFTIK